MPVHLLTREALELYLQHMKPDGFLSVHICNRHPNLQPVVRQIADEFGVSGVLFQHIPT